MLQATDRLAEAEPLVRRALTIDESAFGLNNLAQLLKATDRLTEAEPLTRRVLITFVHFSRAVGSSHPHLQAAVDNYAVLLQAMGRSHDEILATLREIAPELFRK